MHPLLLVPAAAAGVWLYARHRPRTGPGASAATRARQLRTPTVRIATALGVPTRRGHQAARWDAGAEGERRTAALLDRLTADGWTVLHDRALPHGRANVDHLVVSPGGVVILPDSKRWSSRYRVRVVGGRLLHGTHDVTDRLAGLRHEAATVRAVLGVPVTPLVVMHGAPLAAGEAVLDGVRIVPADRLLPVLRALGRAASAPGAAALARRADHALPPYRQGRPR
jgi:Nuclease-related domain